jgi:hypothetical protein
VLEGIASAPRLTQLDEQMGEDFAKASGGMKRILFETALAVAAIVLGLEAVHYRNAVLDANVDRKRAWKTVVELREKCEQHAAVEKPAPADRNY